MRNKQIISKTKKIKYLNRKLTETQSAVAFVNEFEKLNENQLKLFIVQVNHIKQRKWIDDEKQFALSLFHKSPKAYC